MKKPMSLIGVLVSLALLLTACAGTQTAGKTSETAASGESKTQETSIAAHTDTSETEAHAATTAEADKSQIRPKDWSEAVGMGKVGFLLPDFSVTTASDETVTLSEVLKDRELVLINLWATWCPPCNEEFPFLQEAFEAYQDRVAVLALSVEPTDTQSVLKDFAKENGLTFQLGQDENQSLIKCFQIDSIPTSILVDRNGQVVWMEVGAMSSADDVKKLFEDFLKEGGMQAPYGQVRYCVNVQDQNGDPVPGAVVNFCSEESCQPISTDETGVSVFNAELAEYQVQILSLPEGYVADDVEKISIGPWSGNTTLYVTKQG